jgi:hypothetical protein
MDLTNRAFRDGLTWNASGGGGGGVEGEE